MEQGIDTYCIVFSDSKIDGNKREKGSDIIKIKCKKGQKGLERK